ncbi:single-stranded DNA-binding protein [Aspergillus ruber CBS 135680]|uniref:Single-stranded DNA-binding protein n=1 Tax=Aspergillus ruber (strain CBS 135680) TaxID=1388766 RepID=A0A017S7U8_ASPRC|nr:nucleic acid-binding protein [Aspergillus ruber CBS 135680]EYE93088.1 nucleic acid-binding protein [Aspergillus ruber CBS 135680]
MSAIMNSLRPSLRAASTAARSFSTTSRRDLARMILTGRLGTEPELQATASGREVIRYVVASDYGRTQSRKTDWFRVASFPDSESQKNFLLNLPKGSLVYVEADTSLRQYEDAEGKKNTQLSLVQRNIDVLRRPFVRREEGENSEGSESAENQ